MLSLSRTSVESQSIRDRGLEDRPNFDGLGLGCLCLGLGLGGPGQGWRSRRLASVLRPASRPSFDGLGLGCLGLGLGDRHLDYITGA